MPGKFELNEPWATKGKEGAALANDVLAVVRAGDSAVASPASPSRMEVTKLTDLSWHGNGSPPILVRGVVTTVDKGVSDRPNRGGGSSQILGGAQFIN